MNDMKQFLEAVILGGVALFVGAFLGLFLEGILDQYNPENGSIMALMIDNFLPMWFLALIIGVVVLILAVTDAV